jgi:hypothetical protein
MGANRRHQAPHGRLAGNSRPLKSKECLTHGRQTNPYSWRSPVSQPCGPHPPGQRLETGAGKAGRARRLIHPNVPTRTNNLPLKEPGPRPRGEPPGPDARNLFSHYVALIS